MPLDKDDAKVFAETIAYTLKVNGFKKQQKILEPGAIEFALDIMYGVINGKDEADKLIILEAVIEHFNTEFQKKNWLTQGAVHYGAKALPRGPLKSFYDNVFGNEDISIRAKNLLGIVLENSSLAVAEQATIETAQSTRDSDDDATINDEEDEAQNYQHEWVPSEEELEKINAKLVNSYKNVIVSLQGYCNFLLEKKLGICDFDDKDAYQFQLKTIKDTLDDALKNIIDKRFNESAVDSPWKEYQEKNLPISVGSLIRNVATVVRIEIYIDEAISDKITQFEDKKDFKNAARLKEETKRPHSFASSVLDALINLMATLVDMKNKFKAYFTAAKKQNVDAIKYEHRKNNLILFYETFKPGMLDEVKSIKEEVAKAFNLKTPKS